MTRLVTWCLGLCVWVAGSNAALAEDQVSAQRRAAGEASLDSGKRALAQGRHADALRDFEQALASLARPSINYYIGDAAARMGDDARAAKALRAYLAAVPYAPDRAAVEERIAVHERKLGPADRAALAAPAAHAGDLSPNAAARASNDAEPDPGTGQGAQVDEESSGGLWWLWTGVGVAVVATIVAAVVVTSSDDPVQSPRRGDVGGTIVTLEAP